MRILSALMNEIRTEGPLMAELSRRSALGTLQQFTRKAEEFINQEETIGVLTKAKAKDPQSQSTDVKKEVESFSRKKRNNVRSTKAYEKKYKPFQRQSQQHD